MSADLIARAKAALAPPPCHECSGDHSSIMRVELREILADLVPELVAEVEKLLPYAGPGPYTPTGIAGWKAPTWQELRDLADHNFRLYAHARAEVDRARNDLRATDAKAEELRAALSDLVDPDDCHLDHNGDCQAHGFFGGTCGHARAKELLARQAAR